jgi:DNA polymerase-3 subunit epsilon
VDTLSFGASRRHIAPGSSPEDTLIERIAAGWLPSLFVAIDFETANLRSSSACAVAVVRVKAGEPEQARGLLIKPPPGPFLFTWVHGIRRRDVLHAEAFGSAWPRLLPLLDGAAFVAAHNAEFDRAVLETSCEHAGLVFPVLPFVCTVRLARRLWDPTRVDLRSLCRRLGIPLVHHDPGSDATACARIVVAASDAAQSSRQRRIAPFDSGPVSAE